MSVSLYSLLLMVEMYPFVNPLRQLPTHLKGSFSSSLSPFTALFFFLPSQKEIKKGKWETRIR